MDFFRIFPWFYRKNPYNISTFISYIAIMKKTYLEKIKLLEQDLANDSIVLNRSKIVELRQKFRKIDRKLWSQEKQLWFVDFVRDQIK